MSDTHPSQPPLLRVLAPRPGDTAEKPSRQSLIARLRLTAQLHTSLEVDAVIGVFACAMEHELGVTGVGYRHRLLNIDIALGSRAAHECRYQLEQQEHALGEIGFSRASRFSERDLTRIELMLTCLVPALRNALLHTTTSKAAVRDELTGCSNRAALELCATREIAQARRHGTATSMLMVDIDHFKAINDRFGHQAGDLVLREVGSVLRQCCRDCDGVFRFGGEEFVMLLGQTTTDAAAMVGDRVLQAFRDLAIEYDGETIGVTASIGIAGLYLNEGFTSWFKRADQALYHAKNAGRDCLKHAPQRQIA